MKCTVFYNGTSENATANKMSFFEALYFDYKVKEENNSSRINLFIHPKEKITLSKVVVEIPFEFKPHHKVFCNGFQSWSHSKMYRIGETIPQIRGLAKKHFQHYGDEHLLKGKKPDLFSWTYGYINKGSDLFFVGSISESTAFTLIEYDIKSNLIKITKICDDIELSHSFPVLDILVSQGKEKNVFENYFAAIPNAHKKLNSTFGWITCDKHANNISQIGIEKELDNISSIYEDQNIDYKSIFQINDGYQNTIGDWLESSSKFPDGMAFISQKIKAKNMIPGIWIAPFVCSKNSKIYAQHKNWLLKDKNGHIIKAGYHPRWGGWYYALDIYNARFRDYLTEVFYTFSNKWGFEFIAADFLFAAILSPPKDKTKAQVMFDAISLLEQLVGRRKLLTSGVPLGSVFRKVDYCRIGPDLHLAWGHWFLKIIRKRERASTINALETIIHRRHLNKKVFVNNPGVFNMRKYGHKLNENQQYTILLIQILFGSQIFTSDNWKDYNEDTIEEIKGLMFFLDSQIIDVSEPIPGYYQVKFNKELNFVAHINLNKKTISVPDSKHSFNLDAFESVVLKKR